MNVLKSFKKVFTSFNKKVPDFFRLFYLLAQMKRKGSILFTGFIIGFIDGIRLPLILLSFLTLFEQESRTIQIVIFCFIPFVAILLALSHWFTIKNENRVATGEQQRKEKKMYKNIGLEAGWLDEFLPQQHPFITNAFQYMLNVALFAIIGGLLAMMPLLVTGDAQGSFLFTVAGACTMLLIAGFVKGKYYNASPLAEAFRTTIVPLILLGIAYGLTKIF
jgi:hypothetical protein